MTFLLGDVPGVSVVAEGPCEAYVLKHSDLVGMLTQVGPRGVAPKGCCVVTKGWGCGRRWRPRGGTGGWPQPQPSPSPSPSPWQDGLMAGQLFKTLAVTLSDRIGEP